MDGVGAWRLPTLSSGATRRHGGEDERRQGKTKAARVARRVDAAKSCGDTDFTAATAIPTTGTRAGRLSSPQWGTGARNGASVSTRRRSSGHRAAAARTSPALLKVTMPLKDR